VEWLNWQVWGLEFKAPCPKQPELERPHFKNTIGGSGRKPLLLQGSELHWFDMTIMYMADPHQPTQCHQHYLAVCPFFSASTRTRMQKQKMNDSMDTSNKEEKWASQDLGGHYVHLCVSQDETV
jgi:hypothetical protein